MLGKKFSGALMHFSLAFILNQREAIMRNIYHLYEAFNYWETVFFSVRLNAVPLKVYYIPYKALIQFSI